jgi:hypothetical protein
VHKAGAPVTTTTSEQGLESHLRLELRYVLFLFLFFKLCIYKGPNDDLNRPLYVFTVTLKAFFLACLQTGGPDDEQDVNGNYYMGGVNNGRGLGM